jgi:lipoate-protein ligase A
MSLAIEPYALDEGILAATRADGRTRVRVYRPDRVMVVLGRGSDPAVELRTGALLADGVPVARRRGGGCAVVLDPGNAIVSACLSLPGLGRIQQTFDMLTGWLVRGLEDAGVSGVGTDGTSDLVLAGRKIGGSCIYRTRGLVLFSCTILAAPDVSLMERYLAHPPREPAYRAGRAHADFVGSVGETAAARLEGSLSPPPGRTPSRRTSIPAP